MSDLPRAFGSYLLLKNLGTGGTGDVFLARPEQERRDVPSPVVIKRLHGQLAQQSEFVKRFQHEAEIAMAIESAHLAKVYDFGRIDDMFYIAMQYLAGWTVGRVLKDLTDAGGSASIASVADVIRGGLSGLSALHRAKDPKTGRALGIVHRDIAPKNLMIGEDGITRLIDLGLGKSTIQDWRTGTGVVMGSPGYMAPEQVVAEGVDQRSDLYALGIVLWEFLTLKRYIKRAPIPIMLRAQVKPSFAPPSQSRREISKALDAVCERALQHDPAKRFQSADDFIAALDEAVPPRAEEEPLASIVGEMLWGELGQAKTEVTKLLSMGGAMPVIAEVSPAVTPTPLELATPLERMYTPPASNGVPVKGVVALMILTLLVGLGIGVVLLGDRSDRSTQTVVGTGTREPAEPAAVGVSAKEPKPMVSPASVVEAPPPAIVQTPPPPSVLRPIKKIAKVEDSQPAPRPVSIDPPVPPRDRLLALMKRARALRGTAENGAVDALLAKAAQEASASEVNLKVLGELETTLRRLETRAP